MADKKTVAYKSLYVKILQWFYLLLAGVSIALPLLYKQVLSQKLDLPNWFVWGITALVVFYCLLLFLSYLTQNTTLLILALVLVFLTTLVGIALIAVSVPNLHNLIQGGVPKCISDISLCNLKDGIIVSTAAALAVGIPILLLNLLTIVGAVKAIAASD